MLHSEHHESVILMGHSIGSYIAAEVLKRRPQYNVTRLLALFPVLREIALTPNGVSISVSSCSSNCMLCFALLIVVFCLSSIAHVEIHTHVGLGGRSFDAQLYHDCPRPPASGRSIDRAKPLCSWSHRQRIPAGADDTQCDQHGAA